MIYNGWYVIKPNQIYANNIYIIILFKVMIPSYMIPSISNTKYIWFQVFLTPIINQKIIWFQITNYNSL